LEKRNFITFSHCLGRRNKVKKDGTGGITESKEVERQSWVEHRWGNALERG